MKKPVLLVLLVLLLVPVFAARKALIIGNAAYTDKPLKNPVNDATLVDVTLRKVGYQTTLRTDLNGEGFDRAIIEFVRQINYSDEVFFYYSGHGLQINGENFLLPVGDNIFDDVSAQRRGISLKDDIMKRLERARLQIIVLDACRDNPFSNFRSSTKGLAQPPAEAKGYFILYSTSANSVADDGIGDNSDFTKILCKYIETPGIELNALGKKVGKEVNEMNRNQYPDMFTRYYEDYYFTPALPPEPIVIQPAPAPVTTAQTPVPQAVVTPTPVPSQPVATQTVTQPVVNPQPKPPETVVTTTPPASQPKLEPQTQPIPKESVTVPKEEPKPAQPTTVTQLSMPRSDVSTPKVTETPIVPGPKPKASSEIQNQLASKIMYGMKLDGGLDRQPGMDLLFNEGTFLVNGSLYALWQYRQAWIKAGLTTIAADYGYAGYYVPEISLRIPLWIAELHAGWQGYLDGGTSNYDMRLESRIRLGSQLMRVQLAYAGALKNGLGEDIEDESDLHYYYNGPVLYDVGLMETSNFHPDSKIIARMELGNHSGLENPYYLQEASFYELPLAQQEKGSYQVGLTAASSEMLIDDDIDFECNNGAWIAGCCYGQSALYYGLSLSWKPTRNLETRFHYSGLNGDQWLEDNYLLDGSSSKQELGLNIGYTVMRKDNARIDAILGLGSTTWKVDRTSNSSGYTVQNDFRDDRLGGYLGGIIQYRLSQAIALHAKLGLGVENESWDYYNYDNWYGGSWGEADSELRVSPKLALGVNLNYEKLFYRK